MRALHVGNLLEGFDNDLVPVELFGVDSGLQNPVLDVGKGCGDSTTLKPFDMDCDGATRLCQNLFVGVENLLFDVGLDVGDELTAYFSGQPFTTSSRTLSRRFHSSDGHGRKWRLWKPYILRQGRRWICRPRSPF
jgi:hypothetical protein